MKPCNNVTRLVSKNNITNITVVMSHKEHAWAHTKTINKGRLLVIYYTFISIWLVVIE